MTTDTSAAPSVQPATLREMLDAFTAMAARSLHDRDYAAEDALNAQIDAALIAAVPDDLIRLYRAYQMARARYDIACDTVRLTHRLMSSDPYVRETKVAKDEAWDTYEAAADVWFEATVGRPMHETEPGRLLILWRRDRRAI